MEVEVVEDRVARRARGNSGGGSADQAAGPRTPAKKRGRSGKAGAGTPGGARKGGQQGSKNLLEEAKKLSQTSNRASDRRLLSEVLSWDYLSMLHADMVRAPKSKKGKSKADQLPFEQRLRKLAEGERFNGPSPGIPRSS